MSDYSASCVIGKATKRGVFEGDAVKPRAKKDALIVVETNLFTIKKPWGAWGRYPTMKAAEMAIASLSKKWSSYGGVFRIRPSDKEDAEGKE